MEGMELVRTEDGSLYYGAPIDPQIGLQGSGVKKDKDGSWYVGEWNAGLREGFGAAVEHDGLVKIGTWHEDQLYGDCVIVYPPEGPYIAFAGRLAGDHFDVGAAFYKDRRLYYGKFTDWQGAQFNGFGAFRRYNALGRLICAGRWKNGNSDNGCIILRANGRVTGQLMNAPESYSAMAWDDSSERIFFYGITKDKDIRNAEGISFYQDDSAFAGTLRGGVRQGYGVCQCSDGTIRMGEWVGDIQQGLGIWLQRQEKVIRLYIGEFQFDQFSGKGISFAYQDGKWDLSYCGGWEQGQRSGIGLCDLGEGNYFCGAFHMGAQSEPGDIIAEDGSRTVWKKPTPVEKPVAPIKEDAINQIEKSMPIEEPASAILPGVAVTGVADSEKKSIEEPVNAEEQFKLGRSFLYKDNEKALYLLEQSAKQGNQDAQYKLGVCYYKGEGVERDYVKAVEWLEKAAEQGNAEAQKDLGVCYYNGRGVEKDYAKAVRWFQKSAEQGYGEAQGWMGCCYEYGYGVTIDLAKAIEWYRKAAEKGNAFSQERLGFLNYSGAKGIQQNFTEAAKWYLQAAKQGIAAAQKSMGDCYYFGRGVKLDYSQAAEWYRKAAVQGKATAQCSLGLCYYNGKGVEQDYSQAVEWFQKSAKHDNALGQAWLGCCYENGYGVSKDMGFAKYWYQKAAVQGNSFGKRRLDEISRRENSSNNKEKLRNVSLQAVMTWGPKRDTFTLDSPPINAVFNSYTDNPLVGDERDFVRIVENGVGGTYSSDIILEAGKQYQVYIYYDNDASPSASTEKYDYSGVAKDVRLSSNFPDKLEKNERTAISGLLSASNTNPETVWDVAYVTAKEDMTLHYVEGSAKIWTSGKAKGSVLSTKLFSKEGTFLGFDELDGVIPSTDEAGSGSVVYTIQTKKAESV